MGGKYFNIIVKNGKKYILKTKTEHLECSVFVSILVLACEFDDS